MNPILPIVTLAWLLVGEAMTSKNFAFTLKGIKPAKSAILKRTETVAYS
ncbi:hypothetical protein [Flavobacterium xanthum]|nr:hypothetical protein [Flavobacterium xanthum]